MRQDLRNTISTVSLLVVIMLIIGAGIINQVGISNSDTEQLSTDEDDVRYNNHIDEIKDNNDNYEDDTEYSRDVSVLDYYTPQSKTTESPATSAVPYNSNNSNHSSSGSSSYCIDVYDYDNPDDYASDFAEDYGYDEYGDFSEKSYEYGYEDAYQYWMDEMGE